MRSRAPPQARPTSAGGRGRDPPRARRGRELPERVVPVRGRVKIRAEARDRIHERASNTTAAVVAARARRGGGAGGRVAPRVTNKLRELDRSLPRLPAR